MKKIRADILVVQQGIAESRAKAQAMILAGQILTTDGVRIEKAGQLLAEDSPLYFKGARLKFVSRGGLKLEGALEAFETDVRDLVCLDVGASTGGFTDCLLQRGAARVYAIDVGYGQLDWRLRNSEKVILFERTNARALDTKIIPELLDLVVCDVSFISLKKVLLPVKKLLNRKFEILSLVKPQFEARKNEVGRGGIIKDSRIHNRICEELMLWFKQNFDYEYLNIIDSPIKGQKGNKEFFIYIKN